jgi:alpha/beta superfamily hydrolase
MIGRPASVTIDGPAGLVEVVVEDPAQPPVGLAVVAHPNPQMGGTMDNKVVHTLSRAFVLAGWRAVRFNFRGIGRSEGAWADGVGEVDDMLAVIAHHQTDPAMQGLPLALAGFSFGGFVAASACARLTAMSAAPRELVLVGPAARYSLPAVPANTLVVQGEQDDVVSMASVLDWARPQALPVTVVPGVGHFFHGQLPVLREVVLRHLRGAPASS